MLTKTQTVRRIPRTLTEGRHMTLSMRACAACATLEEHDKVLDLSCGDGQLLSHLNRQMRLTLCGLCETPEQARAVRETLMDVDVIPGRMDDIPWRDMTFNAVLLSAGLQQEDARRVLAEALRVLRTGGQLVLTVPAFRAREGVLPKRETMRLMQEAGYRAVSSRAALAGSVIVGWKNAEEDEEAE